MSEVIDGTAIQVPDKAKLEQFDQLPVEEQQTILKQVAEMQSVTANAALRSDKCFDILKEMYRNCATLIMTTSTFVVPVKEDMVNICASLSDPEGFKRSFDTLCTDIFNYNQNLTTLYGFHEGREGAPSEEEVTDVLSLAEGYGQLLTHFEKAIDPLITSLANIVTAEYAAKLEEEVNAIA